MSDEDDQSAISTVEALLMVAREKLRVYQRTSKAAAFAEWESAINDARAEANRIRVAKEERGTGTG